MQIAETNQEIIKLEQKNREATDDNTKSVYIYHMNKTKVELENFIKKFREIEKKKATITDEIKQLVSFFSLSKAGLGNLCKN